MAHTYLTTAKLRQVCGIAIRNLNMSAIHVNIRHRHGKCQQKLQQQMFIQPQKLLANFNSEYQHICLRQYATKRRKKEKTQHVDEKTPKPSRPLIVEMLAGSSKSSVQNNPLDKVLSQLDDRLDELDTLLKSEIHNKDIIEDPDAAFIDTDPAPDPGDYVESITLDEAHTTVNTLPRDSRGVELSGGPDPDMPISDVPCSGCGALLHCQDPGIPGYMTSQLFKSTPYKKLRDKQCQRCHLMQEYNIALDASVSPEEYVQIISEIKNIRALVILVVDVTDFPNSMLKNLPKLIGNKRPVYIVANKVDLLPKDSRGYLNRVKDMIERECESYGLTKSHFVKHIHLMSAKTGYGVEQLVNKLMTDWGRQGPVYLIGCTNVGKSSLFNMLLRSDYCKTTARGLIRRATISLWPGTTLNLLKFPIVNPTGWMLQKRVKRLQAEQLSEVEERKLHASQKKSGRLNSVTLIGRVGVTEPNKKDVLYAERDYQGHDISTYTYDDRQGITEAKGDKDYLHRRYGDVNKEDFNEKLYKESLWCFDTPGVVNKEQIINVLNQAELQLLLSKKLLQPRTYMLKPSQTMFVSGLGRIDFTKGSKYIYMTVFSCINIPVHIVNKDQVYNFYLNNCGAHTLGLPLGDSDRLSEIPSLIGKEMCMIGLGWQESSADILLSSIGWVAVTTGTDLPVMLRAYTPGGYGCRLRTPSLLPFAVTLRGKRKRGTQEYHVRKPKQIF